MLQSRSDVLASGGSKEHEAVAGVRSEAVKSEEFEVAGGAGDHPPAGLVEQGDTSSAWLRGAALSRQLRAHVQMLQRAIDDVEASAIPSNDELDKLISTWIDQQSADQDKCPAEFHETKARLQNLHQHVRDLSGQMNATEIQIQTTTTELQQIHVDQTDIQIEEEQDIRKCLWTRKKNTNMWRVLTAELVHLQNIAASHVENINRNRIRINGTEYVISTTGVSTTQAVATPAPTTPAPTTPAATQTTQAAGTADIKATCCASFSADCLSCRAGLTVDQFCAQPEEKDVPGCVPLPFPVPALYWRVANNGQTSSRPIVKELHFYSDLDCSTPLEGAAKSVLCSGQPITGKSCSNVFDNITTTQWDSQCQTCNIKQAWIGVKLNAPEVVKCVQVDGTLGKNPGVWSGGLVLQSSSDGQLWGDVADEPNQNGLTVLQQARIPGSLLDETPAAPPPKDAGQAEVDSTRLLVTKTLTLAGEMAKCGAPASLLEQLAGSSAKSLWQSFGGRDCSDPTQHCSCDDMKAQLKQTYGSAYVKLSRLVSEYEELKDSDACEVSVRQVAKQKSRPLQLQMQSASQRLTVLTQGLQAFRARIEQAWKAEKQLRLELETLAKRCKSMDDTVESLDKVRTAIHIMDACPGLNKIQFYVPLWLGSWVTGTFNIVDKSDDMVDKEMNALCARQTMSTYPAHVKPGTQPRAAETSEIEQMTVEGMPVENTAPVPLMGVCPNCEGEKDVNLGVTHASGHARICWDPDSQLGEKGRRMDCSKGKKAVMCVVDRDE